MQPRVMLLYTTLSQQVELRKSIVMLFFDDHSHLNFYTHQQKFIFSRVNIFLARNAFAIIWRLLDDTRASSCPVKKIQENSVDASTTISFFLLSFLAYYWAIRSKAIMLSTSIQVHRLLAACLYPIIIKTWSYSWKKFLSDSSSCLLIQAGRMHAAFEVSGNEWNDNLQRKINK